MPVLEEPVTVSIDTILLATDFSMVSEKATAYARGMALRFASSVEVAHVFDPAAAILSEEALLGLPVGDRVRVQNDRLRDLCHTLTREGVTTHAQLSQAHDPARAILALARSTDAGLIVTGTRSRNGIERLFLGSTAEKLIRQSACPVLTVGPSARWPARGPLVFRNIVFATDLSAQSLKALPYALSFAEDSGAHLYLCMVVEEQSLTPYQREHLTQGFREGMQSLIPERARDWCTPECIVEYGDAATSILAAAQRLDAGLIVLGARQSSFWLSYLEHGLTPNIVANSVCPVLTIC
ncbi:Nucleotide-binding universal stress protein, UspA family [Granulicella pectinivorans]|jgi:nucleotide-binding universal stress UspA family protein|uniref:Nucleotide-binding universal stress protein, UspA family n=1 Tax=Granulicella pectinivorans TaxID=474950 RepID=A0A1I6MSM5_9BACT|nr:universal stress protein [Granulicella pectinivorans]SFS18669.1 Nucleotide-binding universal stress protein, UspA family [Granulicella pectinivorans]